VQEFAGGGGGGDTATPMRFRSLVRIFPNMLKRRSHNAELAQTDRMQNRWDYSQDDNQSITPEKATEISHSQAGTASQWPGHLT